MKVVYFMIIQFTNEMFFYGTVNKFETIKTLIWNNKNFNKQLKETVEYNWANWNAKHATTIWSAYNVQYDPTCFCMIFVQQPQRWILIVDFEVDAGPCHIQELGAV